MVSHLSDLKGHVLGYVRISEYLNTISKNEYTAGSSYEVEHIEETLSEIARYQFEGDSVYTLTIADPTS